MCKNVFLRKNAQRLPLAQQSREKNEEDRVKIIMLIVQFDTKEWRHL